MKTISAINLNGAEYAIDLDDGVFAKAMKKYMSQHEPTYYKIECQSCGAPIDQEIGNHILKCPYCHSAYVIGTKMINSMYSNKDVK